MESKCWLRSLLEASIGVAYIVEKDSEQRDIAYQVAHAHRRIKLYQRWDMNTPQGKQVNSEMAGVIWQSLKPQKIDLPKAIANMESLLKTPKFVPVEAEWQNFKAKHPKAGDPVWYSLFGGPMNMRAVAKPLNMRGEYEFLYRDWSDSIHAGNAMSQIKSFQQDGELRAVIMPPRWPENLSTCLSLAVRFCLKVGNSLIVKYAPADVPAFKQRSSTAFKKNIRT